MQNHIGRHGCLLLGLLLFASAPARAHQPGTINLDLLKALDKGKLSFLVDQKGKGDTKLQYIVRNEDPDMDVLLVFPACSFEGEEDERIEVSTPQYYEGFKLDSLEDVLSGAKPPPSGPGVQRDPIWALCQQTKSFLPGHYLLKRGAYLKLLMSIDFRNPAPLLAPDDPDATSFKIPIHSHFDVYAIPPEQGDEVIEALLASRKPKAPILESFLRKVRRGAADARQYFSLYYDVEGDPRTSPDGTFLRTNYEDLFLPDTLDAPPDEGSGIENREIPPGSNLLFALDDYRTPKKNLPDAALVYDPQHADIFQIPTDSAGPDGGSFCEVLEERPDCFKFRDLCADDQRERLADTNASAQSSAATFNVTGRFSVKQTDHLLHPGWGWRAVAWWDDSGTWRKLASEWVQYDGSFALTINYSGYSGQNLKVQFRAYNRYYEPQDQDNNLYRWVNPQKFSISTNHDEGHRYADADGGDANGIGEMYRGAYELWSKAYWTGEFNPLRPDPVIVYTPNTWYDCTLPLNTGSGGTPWSCASNSGSGTIWLTAAHSIDAEVVQHEFAHNVTNEFWDNKLPADCCGSHTLCGVFTEGLALNEGYANFMPAWVQCSSTNASCNTGMGRIEGNLCTATTTRNLREGWVAQVFWDLHDKTSDGSDVLWFNHPGAVHSIYFQNGPAASGDPLGITDFQSHYENAASPGHSTYIADIFDQNVN